MIGLMDCNNFFVSCERLFRPDLQKRPVAVLSSNDGCIVARSQEVKDMGVPMGIPYFKIKNLCDERKITLFSSNFALYRDISSRVMSALKDEGFMIQVYSVDEAFFELPEDIHEEEVRAIRNRIMQKTGIPVSIGVADTKTLAKLANDTAKKGSGIYILKEAEREEFLQDIPCGTVWGIGGKTALKLQKAGVLLASEFLTLPKSTVQKMLGVIGERLHLELSGVSVYPVGDTSHDVQESYTSSRSFGTATHKKEVVKSALIYHTERLAEKLRRGHVSAKSVSILARGSRHGAYAQRRSVARKELALPTNDTFALVKEVEALFDELYDAEIPYKKAGVTLGSIYPDEVLQVSLFTDHNQLQKTGFLGVILDTLNQLSPGTGVHLGTSLYTQMWQDKKALKSREYTTAWSEIPSVKAM